MTVNILRWRRACEHALASKLVSASASDWLERLGARPSRSLKVSGIYTDRSATYDFLLVIRSDHGLGYLVSFPR